MIRLSFLLILTTMILSSCDKDPYDVFGRLKLPPATMTGENTFGCKINGKVWVAWVKDPSLFNSKLDVNYDTNNLTISGNFNDAESKNETVHLTINFPSAGIFSIPPPPFDGSVFGDLKNPKSSCISYKTDYRNTKIKITNFDENKGIVSGTFEYKQAVSCGDTIDITEGRFDVRFR